MVRFCYTMNTNRGLKIKGYNGVWRAPTNVLEYFTILYCNRKQLLPRKRTQGPLQAWKTLSSAQQKIFNEKFEMWQDLNHKKMTDALEHIEPFLKPKSSKKKINAEFEMTKSKDEIHDIDDNHEDASTNVPENTCSNMSISGSEISNQTIINAEFEMTKSKDEIHDIDDNHKDASTNVPENTCSNMSISGSEISNQFYAASVIDPEIDEDDRTVQQETNETINEIPRAPTPPTVMYGRDLFERIKSSGSRPELARVEYCTLTPCEKKRYNCAVQRIHKTYLNKYEEYLHSLPSPELFKHYIQQKSLPNSTLTRL